MVIIYVDQFHDLYIEELWIRFGVGNNFRHIPVHAIAKSLQAEKSKEMMMFHMMSSFLGKGKTSA